MTELGLRAVIGRYSFGPAWVGCTHRYDGSPAELLAELQALIARHGDLARTLHQLVSARPSGWVALGVDPDSGARQLSGVSLGQGGTLALIVDPAEPAIDVLRVHADAAVDRLGRVALVGDLPGPLPWPEPPPPPPPLDLSPVLDPAGPAVRAALTTAIREALQRPWPQDPGPLRLWPAPYGRRASRPLRFGSAAVEGFEHDLPLDPECVALQAPSGEVRYASLADADPFIEAAQHTGAEPRAVLDALAAAVEAAGERALPGAALEVSFAQGVELFRWVRVVDTVAQPDREIVLAEAAALHPELGTGVAVGHEVGLLVPPGWVMPLLRWAAEPDGPA